MSVFFEKVPHENILTGTFSRETILLSVDMFVGHV